MKLKLIVIGLISVVIVGCSCDRQEPQQVQQAPAPIIVQNDSGSGTGEMLAAGAAGYVIGQMMSNGQRYDGHNAYHTPKTVVVKKYYNKRPSYSSRPSYRSSFKKSYSSRSVSSRRR